MAKLTGHYFWRGRKIMTRYFRRNASGLLLYFAYSIARFIGDLLIILIPAFATSAFNSGHMLKETGDLYLSKSFDNAEDKAAYRALAIFSAIVLLAGAAFIGVLVGLELYINFLLNLIILNPDSAMIFKIMVITVFSIIELIAFLYVFGLLQAGSYISRKNTKLGVGDIAFNAMNYMKNHGGKIMSLDFGIIFFYAIWVVIYPVGWFLFPELSSTGANIFPVLFTILRYVELLLMMIHLVILIPHFVMMMTISPYLLFEETADASRHVIIYPEKPGEKTEPDTRGRYINAIPLNELLDDDSHPVEVNSEDGGYRR